MTRLIDADGLKNTFWHGDLVPHKEMYHISEIKYAIDNAPTVEERPQGEWEYQYRFCDEKLYKCTHCGRLLSIHNVQDISQFHFCQECGADMRGGR